MKSSEERNMGMLQLGSKHQVPSETGPITYAKVA
jgi:hypothetical protein